MIESPGVACGAEVGDVSCTSECELVQVHLAHDDGAALLQADDNVSILGWNTVLEHWACGGGAGAGGVYVVLQPDGNAVQGPAKPACFLLFVEDGGLRERFLAHDSD